MKPDFNRASSEGQMSPVERKQLYDTIIKYRPYTVFEIGTWKGGGSTYFISSALKENKQGKLFTVECNKDFFLEATKRYTEELSELSSYICFNYGKSDKCYEELLRIVPWVDFLLLDGAEDPLQTYSEFIMIEPKLSRHAIVLCHDWKKSKADNIRSILTNQDEWEELFVLDTLTGFAGFRRK